MNDLAREQSLVVIAVDASESGELVIELAGSLTDTPTPELLGLYVENALLLDHARSCRAREILLTGAERPLDRQSLTRQLHAQAERARMRFEAASNRLGLRNRFEIARGDIFAEPIRRAAAARALVVAPRMLSSASSASLTGFLQQILDARLPLVLLAREGWRRGRNIAVVVDEFEAADAQLQAAARIAIQCGSSLTVLLTLPPDAEQPAFVRAVETALQGRGVEQCEIILVRSATPLAIGQAARACQARLLVVPAQAQASQALRALFQGFPGTLLLVRPLQRPHESP